MYEAAEWNYTGINYHLSLTYVKGASFGSLKFEFPVSRTGFSEQKISDQKIPIMKNRPGAWA